MQPPFSPVEFLAVFARYNTDVWPAQLGLLGLAALSLLLTAWGGPRASRRVAAMLAVVWVWMGVVYHGRYFTAINPAAWGFAAAFVAEAALLAWYGVVRGRLDFRYTRDPYTLAGGVAIAYALAVYPLLSHLLGHSYPFMPTFGVPCPTTIFTLGLLLCAARPVPALLLVVPVAWALIGFSAVWAFGIVQDAGLLVAGVGTAVLLARRDGLPGRRRAAGS